MALQHFIFVTHDAPGSVRLAADFNKHLMRVPLSRCDLAHAGYPLHSCLDGKQAQIERPHARTFMEDADLSLVKQIFDVPHDREGGMTSCDILKWRHRFRAIRRGYRG